MSLQRGSLIVVLLAVLLDGRMAFADTPTDAAQTAPVAETAGSTPPVTTPASPAVQPATSQAPVSQIPAAQTTTGSPVTRAPGPVSGGSTSGMVSGLIFLLVLVLGAAWLIKRAGGMPALRGGSSMKVVAALSLGPRERVVLIELGGQQWLLGVGGNSVTTLHHFEQPIVTGGGDDFAGKLRQFLPQGIGSQGPGK